MSSLLKHLISDYLGFVLIVVLLVIVNLLVKRSITLPAIKCKVMVTSQFRWKNPRFIYTTGPLIAEPQKVTSTPEIIIAPTETDVLEKNATNVSLQEADPINLVTTTTEKITEEIVPFPDRVSAPYAVQFETPVKTSVSPSKAKEFESYPSASPLEGNDTMENNSLHRDDTLTPQTSFSTEVTTVAKPSVFGDLFDKNGVFIGEEWNASPPKSRGGRPIKPSQKMLDSDWPRKRGRRDRVGHG